MSTTAETISPGWSFAISARLFTVQIIVIAIGIAGKASWWICSSRWAASTATIRACMW